MSTRSGGPGGALPPTLPDPPGAGRRSEPESRHDSGPGAGARPRHSAWFYFWSGACGLFLLFLLVLAGVIFYASTPQFANKVRQRVIAALTDATGGRVELQAFHWSLSHLAVEADNLTIHGLEQPGEIPYAHIDRLYARIRFLSFLQPKIALSYLEADRPVVHLIVYPDGSTNQPRPRATSNHPRQVTQTIFALQVEHTELRNGFAILNQRSFPFTLRANDTEVDVSYLPDSDQYAGEARVADLDFQRASEPALPSKLLIEFALARNRAEIKAAHFSSAGSALDASGSLENFADPHWKIAARGRIDLREAAALTGVDGLRGGTADLDVAGQGALHDFLLAGNVRASNASYQTSYVSARGVDAAMRFHMDPDEITVDGIHALLREGGSVDAALHFLHWNAPAGPPAPAQENGKTSPRAKTNRNRRPPEVSPIRFQATIRAEVHGIRLPTLLRMVASRRYQDVGFDTVADGPVNVDWTGSGEDLAAAAKMQLHAPRSSAPRQIPLSGFVDAAYSQRRGQVQIRQLEVHTPSTDAGIAGTLSVYPITAASALRVDLKTDRLAEFDHLLADLGLAANGKKGAEVIPVELHGPAEFTGTLGGPLLDPDIKGHLTAIDFSSNLTEIAQLLSASQNGPQAAPPEAGAVARKREPAGRSIRWDRLDATGEVSSQQIVVQQAELTGGGTAIEAHGHIQAHRINARRSAFDDLSPIAAEAQIHQAALGDLLALAGPSIPFSIRMSGKVNLQAQVSGSLGNLNGGADLGIRDGEFAGEPYQSIAAHLSLAGQRLDLVKLTLLKDGGTVAANGSYDLESKHFLVNLDGTRFELARFRHLSNTGFPIAGSLKFDAHASGTAESPSILVGIHLTNLMLGGQSVGGIEGLVHTENGIALFTGHLAPGAARLDLSGQTVLHGEFQTTAKLELAGFDIDPWLKIFHVERVSGHSLVGGTVTLAGSAKDPKRFGGQAELTQFSLTLQGLPLTSEGPLRASIEGGVLHITQGHITGPDTDMTVTGSADLMGNRALDLAGRGSVNMRLAQTFDPDIAASGHVDFDVAAAGTLTLPVFTGKVQLTRVSIALNDLPNGLSNLNGTLVFDQDRLEVQNLVGTTGGGQVKVAGFITYQRGIYADLTATGKDVRVRYSGVSATADTTLRLQGPENNLLLNGNVLISRFVVGPKLDFAMFASSPIASEPPNPNAASNHVRLDIHIVSSPQLDFQNSYAQLAGSVDLHLRGTIAQPSVLGRINITEGTANFAGTLYQLQHGDIYFTNPVRIDPVIDLDATTRIEEYDITVGLHGASSRLSPTFRSDPPLAQADVISLLALGYTQEEQQLYSQEQDQTGVDSTTNALLGGALNATVGSRVQRLFGVGAVKIDPTYLGNLGNSTARITVQQNISRNVQLTYATNVNTTAEQLIQAQVDLTENLSVLALRDESGVFSIVFKVHKRLR